MRGPALAFILLLLLLAAITASEPVFGLPPSLSDAAQSHQEKLAIAGQRAVDAAFKRFDATKLPVVIIRGLFSSGTGWLRSLLSLNCPTQIQYKDPLLLPPAPKGGGGLGKLYLAVDADGLYGWKHTYFNAYEQHRFNKRRSHFMVVLSRDAMTWAHSTFKMTFMSPRGSAVARSFPLFMSNRTLVENPPPMPFLQYFYATAKVKNVGQLGPALQGKGVFHVRKLVYANLLGVNLTEWEEKMAAAAAVMTTMNGTNSTTSAPPLLPPPHRDLHNRTLFLQYESLRNDSAGVFVDLLNQFAINCSNVNITTFKKQESLVKMQVVYDKVQVMQRHARAAVCRELRKHPPGLYESMRSSLDLEFERQVLGYEYAETMEEYCPPAEPTLKPTPRPTHPPHRSVQQQQDQQPFKIIVHSSVEIIHQPQQPNHPMDDWERRMRDKHSTVAQSPPPVQVEIMPPRVISDQRMEVTTVHGDGQQQSSSLRNQEALARLEQQLAVLLRRLDSMENSAAAAASANTTTATPPVSLVPALVPSNSSTAYRLLMASERLSATLAATKKRTDEAQHVVLQVAQVVFVVVLTLVGLLCALARQPRKRLPLSPDHQHQQTGCCGCHRRVFGFATPRIATPPPPPPPPLSPYQRRAHGP